MNQFHEAVEREWSEINSLVRCAERDMAEASLKHEELSKAPNYKDTPLDKESMRAVLTSINELAKKLPQ